MTYTKEAIERVLNSKATRRGATVSVLSVIGLTISGCTRNPFQEPVDRILGRSTLVPSRTQLPEAGVIGTRVPTVGADRTPLAASPTVGVEATGTRVIAASPTASATGVEQRTPTVVANTDAQKIAALQTQLAELRPAATRVSVGSPTVEATRVSAETIKFVEDVSHGVWQIKGTDRLKDNPIVKTWLSRLKDPAPAKWKRFPNIPNPDVPEFKVVNGKQVPMGMEYGTYNTPFSEHPEGADFIVGAWEYRLYTGPYTFMGEEHNGDKQTGEMLLVLNVMNETVNFRGNKGNGQRFDNGFTLRGRYFDGDNLEWGTWGLVSHTTANMLNMETFAREGELLNAGAPGNSGANCGTPEACKKVNVNVIVVAGDAVIAQAKTVVAK